MVAGAGSLWLQVLQGRPAQYGAGVHSQQAGLQKLITYKPECKASLPAAGAWSCMAMELPAVCLPRQHGQHLSLGLCKSTKKVKPAQAAEIAARAGGMAAG